MDPEAPFTVVKGSLAIGTLATVYATLIAVVQTQNPFAFGINGAIGGGTVGLSYFAFREYMISPLLVNYLPLESYLIRRDVLTHARASLRATSSARRNPTSQSAREAEALKTRAETDRTLIRWDRVLDSGLAAGITGGWVGWWAKRYRGMTISPSRSAIQLGAITASIQFVINTGRIMRLDYLASRAEDASSQLEGEVLNGRTGGEVSGDRREGQRLEDVMHAEKRNWPLKEQSLRPDASPQSSPQVQSSQPTTSADPNEKSTLTTRLTTYLSSLSPIRRLSDTEYHTILVAQRAELLSQLTHSRALTEIERSEAEKREREKEGWFGGLGVGPGNGESELERQLDMVRGKLEGLEERMSRTETGSGEMA